MPTQYIECFFHHSFDVLSPLQMIFSIILSCGFYNVESSAHRGPFNDATGHFMAALLELVFCNDVSCLSSLLLDHALKLESNVCMNIIKHSSIRRICSDAPQLAPCRMFYVLAAVNELVWCVIVIQNQQKVEQNIRGSLIEKHFAPSLLKLEICSNKPIILCFGYSDAFALGASSRALYNNDQTKGY